MALCAAILHSQDQGIAKVVDALEPITVEAMQQRLAGIRSFDDLTGGERLKELLGLIDEANFVDQLRALPVSANLIDVAGHDLGNGLPVLSAAERGSPRLTWCVGIEDTGDPVWAPLDHDEPHVLIAGATGSGKSAVVHSMLLQLMHNSTPDDLELWIMEPKVELQHYEGKAHVRRFEAPARDGRSAHQVSLSVFSDLAAEMDRRLELMAKHPEAADTRRARELLGFPSIVLVVEECSAYLAAPVKNPDAASPDERADFLRDLRLHQQTVSHVVELARKGRVVGIHMVLVTQDAGPGSLPSSVKVCCRRIGLRTLNAEASRHIVGSSALAELDRLGYCMVSTEPGVFVAVQTFGLGSQDDFAELLGRLPDAS